MKANIFITIVIAVLPLHTAAQVNNAKSPSVFKGYTNSRAPLFQNPYMNCNIYDTAVSRCTIWSWLR